MWLLGGDIVWEEGPACPGACEALQSSPGPKPGLSPVTWVCKLFSLLPHRLPDRLQEAPSTELQVKWVTAGGVAHAESCSHLSPGAGQGHAP